MENVFLLCLTSYLRINSRGTVDLNAKGKTVSFQINHIEHHVLSVGKDGLHFLKLRVFIKR